MARTIAKSVGRGGLNLFDDVKLVQSLINDNLAKLPGLRPLTVDGRVGPKTIAAIEEFQKRVVKMAAPDGRVDPNGRTLAFLNEGVKSGPVTTTPSTTIRIVFQHHSKTPVSETTATAGTDDLYESTVTVSGGLTGAFRGSIFPDDMSVKGRIKDGTYDLYLGFHKRQGHTPRATDLEVRENGFRAALIVNNDKPVPVISDNPDKKTSEAIHVHNGFKTHRYSDGCPTLHPSDWSKFLKLFLDAYKNLADWTETSTYVGKKIGVLEVKA